MLASFEWRELATGLPFVRLLSRLDHLQAVCKPPRTLSSGNAALPPRADSQVCDLFTTYLLYDPEDLSECVARKGVVLCRRGTAVLLGISRLSASSRILRLSYQRQTLLG